MLILSEDITEELVDILAIIPLGMCLKTCLEWLEPVLM